MSDTGRLVDALGLFLTGGSANTDPDSSLGGAVSSTRVLGLGAKVSNAIPGVRIDRVFPACGTGDATLQVNTSGNLVLTEPGGSAGTAVAIAAGESKVLTGSATGASMRVTRESGLVFANPAAGSMTATLVNPMNGVIAHGNVSSAQRAAGVTTYRCLMFYAQGTYPVLDLKVWLPVVAGAQATYAVGKETASGDTVQTVADEETAPTAVTFSSPTTAGTALDLGNLSAGSYVGLWIRRAFPSSGVVDALESVQLAVRYEGA